MLFMAHTVAATELDRIIDDLKREETINGNYIQDMAISEASEVAASIRKYDRVLLVGGGKEKYVIQNAAPSTVSVDLVQSQHPNILGDIEAGLPLPPEDFDHVVMFNLFEVLYNPRAACSEAYRLLKNGGKFWVRETYGPRSQGFGLLLNFSNYPNIEDELRGRGLVYYPDGMSAYSISPGFITNSMRMGGFSGPIETRGNLTIATKI